MGSMWLALRADLRVRWRAMARAGPAAQPHRGGGADRRDAAGGV